MSDRRKELKYLLQEQAFIEKIEEFIDDPVGAEEFISQNYNNYFPALPNGEYKIRLLTRLYRERLREDPEKGHHNVFITDKEIAFLQSLPTDQIKRVFYALFIQKKTREHPSGWIFLDFDKTMSYSLDRTLIYKLKIEILSQCVEYGLEFQVSGSNRPILCFRLPPIEEGKIVFEFEDGTAKEHFEEVIGYGNNSD